MSKISSIFNLESNGLKVNNKKKNINTKKSKPHMCLILFAILALNTFHCFTPILIEGRRNKDPYEICRASSSVGVIANPSNILYLIKILQEAQVESAFVFGWNDHKKPMILTRNGTLSPYIEGRNTSKYAFCIGVCPSKPRLKSPLCDFKCMPRTREITPSSTGLSPSYQINNQQKNGTELLPCVPNNQPPPIVTQPSSCPCQQLLSVVTQPPLIVAQPPPIVTQPPLIVTQPPPIVTQPPLIVTQPPPIVTQPPPCYCEDSDLKDNDRITCGPIKDVRKQLEICRDCNGEENGIRREKEVRTKTFEVIFIDDGIFGLIEKETFSLDVKTKYCLNILDDCRPAGIPEIIFHPYELYTLQQELNDTYNQKVCLYITDDNCLYAIINDRIHRVTWDKCRYRLDLEWVTEEECRVLLDNGLYSLVYRN